MDAQDFELITGSVIGRDHRLRGRNCQDAALYKRLPGLTIAVVADGCGSAPFSEVGATIGVRLVIRSLSEQWERAGRISMDRTERDITSDLHQILRAQGGSYELHVMEQFLFTLMVATITHDTFAVHAFGDGVYAVNENVSVVEPADGNQPPYIAYRLLGADRLHFDTVASLPPADVHSFLIGSDGVTDLLGAQDRLMPGSDKPVGPISQFWTDEALYRNQVLLTRRLGLIGRDSHRREPSGHVVAEPGLLPDDTTLIIGRQKGGERA